MLACKHLQTFCEHECANKHHVIFASKFEQRIEKKKIFASTFGTGPLIFGTLIGI